MDGRAMYPEGWHPQRPLRNTSGQFFPKEDIRSRTATGGTRYYFIDFGISRRDQDLVSGREGQQFAPELLAGVPYDPYKVDVYLLGLAYKEILLEVRSCCHLSPLESALIFGMLRLTALRRRRLHAPPH